MTDLNSKSIEFEKALCKFLSDWGYLDEKKLRDDKIKVEFYNLRQAGVKVEEAQRILSERFFISVDTINSVIYRK